ncbi:hypothetical protein HKD37_02G003137 [Glycine soja]
MTEVVPSSANPDPLEVAIVELAVAQLRFAMTQASMASKLDVIILKLNTMVPNQHFLSSSTAKSPPTVETMSIPLPMATSHLLLMASPTHPPLTLFGPPFTSFAQSLPAAASFPPASTYPFPSCSSPRSGTQSSTTHSSSPSTQFSSLPNGSASATIFIYSFLHPL